MRPVRRGDSPISDDYSDYEESKVDLVSRLGLYCSYCERRIPTNLAVEHLQPKDLAAYVHLVGTWNNFLLACVNCNSTKGNKDVDFAKLFFPDRDNTFIAFQYQADGTVRPSPGLSPQNRVIGIDTLQLTGLMKPSAGFLDENGRAVYLDRVGQRMEQWGIAESARDDIELQPQNDALKQAVVNNAKASGFFSVWMTVFEGLPDMQNAFVDAFPGTRASECFEGTSCRPVSPAPNPDGLAGGGKI